MVKPEWSNSESHQVEAHFGDLADTFLYNVLFKVNSILIGVTSHLIDIGYILSKGNHTETVQGITRPSFCPEISDRNKRKLQILVGVTFMTKHIQITREVHLQDVQSL